MKIRKQIRLKDFDYSSNGYYFVTICTQNRECAFGEVINGEMILNQFGYIVDNKINELTIYKNVEIDVYCIMPNHVHLIIIIVGADPRVRPFDQYIVPGSTQGSTPTIGEYVKRFKTLTTNIYIKHVKKDNWPKFNKRLWQRNYYEHIIRNEHDLNRIHRYMTDNSTNWDEDINNFL